MHARSAYDPGSQRRPRLGLRNRKYLRLERCRARQTMCADVGAFFLGREGFGALIPPGAISETAGSYREPLGGDDDLAWGTRVGPSGVPVHTRCELGGPANTRVFWRKTMSAWEAPSGWSLAGKGHRADRPAAYRHVQGRQHARGRARARRGARGRAGAVSVRGACVCAAARVAARAGGRMPPNLACVMGGPN
jgi:hypothetical protein